MNDVSWRRRRKRDTK